MKMDPILKITSFNCAGAKFRNYQYLKEVFSKCDIILLQETWLHNFKHYQFKDILPDCQYHAVSAMDDANGIV